MQSLESAFGKALHQPMPFTTGGQTITDRLTAAKHSIAGSQLGKTICKATTEELMAPKKKHCDYLLHCTNEPNVSIPSMANLLIERTQNPNWIVIYKALITIHNLMCYGNERFSQYLASCNTTINLSGFLDKSNMQTSAMAAGYDMSMHVRRYAKYISEKIHTYRLCAFDFCKLKRGREDGVLRVMHVDKLLKTAPILQNQIDALLEFQVTSSELNNGVINCSFILLFRDLIRLFACYNDGIINLLEKYFDMNKKQCREALDIYKAFLFRLDRVSEFLRIAESVGIDRGEIPDLTRAPASLLEALEAHLYHLEGGKGAPPVSNLSLVNQQQNDSMGGLTHAAGGSVDELAKQRYLDAEKERLRQFEEQRQRQLQQQDSADPSSSAASFSNPFGSGAPATSGNTADLLSFYDSPATKQQQPPLDTSNPFAAGLFDSPAPAQQQQPQQQLSQANAANPFMSTVSSMGGGPSASTANPFGAFSMPNTGYHYNQSGMPPPMHGQTQPPFGQFCVSSQAQQPQQQAPSSGPPRPGIYHQTPFGPPQPSRNSSADTALSSLVGGLRISSTGPQAPSMPPMYTQPSVGFAPRQVQQPWNAFGDYNPNASYGGAPFGSPQMPNYGVPAQSMNPMSGPGMGFGCPSTANFLPQQPR